MKTDFIKLLLIGTGGFAGSILRYLVSTLSSRFLPAPYFPYGTLTVNVTGCLLIGFLAGIFEMRYIMTPEIRMFLFIGFLGGFTTYSTFGYEIVTLLRDGQALPAVINLGLHLVLGLGAVFAGLFFSKILY